MTKPVSDYAREMLQAQRHAAAGQMPAAETIYRKIIEAAPGFHPAWHALGLLAFKAGHLEWAVESITRAVMLDGHVAIYQRDLGEMSRRLGRLEQAIACGLAATKLAARDVDAHCNLALAYADAGKFTLAIKSYRKALKINPAHAAGWRGLGSVLERQGDQAEARKAFARATALEPSQPADPEISASAVSRHEEGIAHYKQGRLGEALACYEQALGVLPDFPAALNSKGFVLQDLGRIDEARDCFARAVQLAPELAIARLNLGLAQLKLGDWQSGWEHYEARWTGSAESGRGEFSLPDCPLPQWQGQGGTENQSLLIFTEQGFGDTFQFSRYLSLVAQRFSRVSFICSLPTLRLLDWAFGEDVVLSSQIPQNFDAWDWQCPLMSLPRAFGTRPETVPAGLPYLRVPAKTQAHWRQRLELAAPGRFRIGIAWAGRKEHQYDVRRSLSFEQITPLLRDERVTWVSLQKWGTEHQRPMIPVDTDWLDWTDELSDFSDTAALIANLDLVISIDSAMVHLAGALNRPVWMMNRFDSEWRWFHRREDSPWYPRLRIFNQPAFGDWDSVLSAVQEALKALPVPQTDKLRRQPALPSLSIAQTLQQASQFQSAGRLPEAKALLHEILHKQARNAPALHLLGVGEHLSGQPVLAVQLISEAIGIEPENALFHSNLAEIYRQQGKQEEAIRHGLRAVEINPALASAHSNLGIAYYDARDYDKAEACHRQALALNPGMGQSLNNLGSIQRARNDLPGAIALYRQVLEVQPDSTDVLSNLGAVLLEAKQLDAAVSVLEKALQLRPDHPEALCNLGLVRFKLDKEKNVALALLQSSLQLKPDHLEALLGLARLQHEQGSFGEAEALLRRALAKDPGNDGAYCLLGVVLTEQDDAMGGKAAFEQALHLNPDSTEARVGLGVLCLESGAFEEAKGLFREVLAVEPENISAHFHLAQAGKIKSGGENLATLEAMLPKLATLEEDQRIILHYTLGKTYDDLGEYARAFPHFMAGACLKRSKLNDSIQTENEQTRRILEIVDEAFVRRMAGSGDSSEQPVFVLGMPRSGTTLTEQIIASHPEVHGAGELKDLLRLVLQTAPGQNPRPFPENWAALDRETLTAWGRQYAAGLRQRAPGARCITDKMPANYQALGLIPLMLPNARIIHVKRNPVDTCLSCFTRLFSQEQSATYDLRELGQHYRNYASLMAHWRTLMPGRFLEVQYEEIVADLDTQAKRLIAFCGLEWDEACLAFHKNKRNIRTASLTQVRQPIYTNSVERWRHYESFLAPLLEALGDLVTSPRK